MKTWKKIVALSGAAALSLGLSACGGSSSSSSSSSSSESASGETVTLKVGASPSPHAVILNYIKENLASEAGLNLDIVEYQDYVQPNEALNDGELDANYYQTVPYLESESKSRGYNFQHGSGIHLEPVGIYSNNLKSLDEIKDGDKVGIINDPTNQSRALKLLAANNLIKLPTDEADQTVAAIESSDEYNPRHLKFTEAEGPLLVRTLDDVAIGVINGNFALSGGKKPSEALVLESTTDNPSVNVLVWKTGTSKETAIKKLDELLHSDKVKQFIETEYPDKSVIPAF